MNGLALASLGKYGSAQARNARVSSLQMCRLEPVLAVALACEASALPLSYAPPNEVTSEGTE
jgi:hypothetical protein